MNSKKFNLEYYKSGNYVNYLERKVRYEKIAKDIIHLLSPPVLDFGCGVGFLTLSLFDLGIAINGYDISSCAINYGKNTLKIKNITCNWKDCKKIKYNTLIALDVFEHISLKKINEIFKKINAQILIVRIPVCLKSGQKFVLEISNKDKTHITCLSKQEWEHVFSNHGYKLHSLLDFECIWDSDGVLSRIYSKN